MLYPFILAMGLLTASVVADTATCYDMNRTAWTQNRIKPCNPNAGASVHSACCALDGNDPNYNDLCMDSGLCLSTDGWWATYLFADGCTDPTFQDKSCPNVTQYCSSVSASTYNIQQCSGKLGTFCCRAGDDTKDCCDGDNTFVANTTIGHLYLPGTIDQINTTYGKTDYAAWVNKTPPRDKSSVIGGVLGGLLGTALIASLLALWYSLRSRKSLKDGYSILQQERDAALQQSDQKAALQQQFEQQYSQYQQQTQAPTYTLNPSSGQYQMYYTPSAALPLEMPPPLQAYPTEMLATSRPVEMDTMRNPSELSDETVSQVTRIEEVPKNTE
ncbi:hypothetical protein EDD37DRAFT_661432 [Exophiala viscosa]|uniref:uncharacterized protein n=1 Tax=Exophiala viscosa TaxID=2486360 RepID=UPI00219563F0|nr:hypothetical protein EDD37DRAFT_661432 [Exophiala viscosa]